MFAAEQVNADPAQCAVVDTNKMPWQPTAQPGLSIKVLERVHDPVKGRETALFKLEPGTTLPAETLMERQEMFVLEGSFSRERLHAELGEIVSGQKAGRESDEEIIILNPMGMAKEATEDRS